jgi:Predicted esterase of the alpha-beta hydrolase superfamily
LSDSGNDNTPRRISLALQGGGAHGAFTWGVLDRLLEEPRLVIEAISGTSAGAMNAAALAAGYAAGGAEGARRALERFWLTTSAYAMLSPIRRTPLHCLTGQWNIDFSPVDFWLNVVSRAFSPYQTNPLNLQPLRLLLAQQIDIEAVRACETPKVFVTATNVRTGRPRVFHRHELTVDALLASACIPHLYQAVEIDGEAYWDGGYMGNPAIWPLIYEASSADVVLVPINPVVREAVPRTAFEIDNRVNEIAFNSSLMHEMRAVAFVQKLLEEDALKEPFASRYRNIRLHRIGDEQAMASLGVVSKGNAEREFLEYLRDAGRACADRWLAENFDALGVRSSLDVRAAYL